ncbi:MAG: phosphoglucosamine mutase [Desulfosudaceae bacterium]
MAKLFGTDGIRGVANQPPLTVETAVAVGRALVRLLRDKNKARPDQETISIVIGRDTRLSGDMLESAFCAGACSMGADVFTLGVFPTPGVACLTRAEKAAAGVVISASHNPYTDNGIKIFDHNGHKLSQSLETRLEEIIEQVTDGQRHDFQGQPGRIRPLPEARDRYAMFLNQTVFAGPLSLSGSRSRLGDLRLVVDCANGSAGAIADKVMTTANFIFNHPDGRNINEQCGSEHPRELCRQVKALGADAGFAFDGDADRVVAVDETGRVLTGDRILAMCANFMKADNSLKNNLVVSTVMSNIGLSRALREMGIDHLTSDVGDRHVLEKMRASGAVIGGEDSGHMIFSEHQTTGDGLLAALILCRIMQHTGRRLSDLAGCMEVYPQELINVPVKDKPDLDTVASVRKTIKEETARLKQDGRVLVRYSGTQPLCRVMVEAPTATAARQVAGRIAGAIEEAIGG